MRERPESVTDCMSLRKSSSRAKDCLNLISFAPTWMATEVSRGLALSKSGRDVWMSLTVAPEMLWVRAPLTLTWRT